MATTIAVTADKFYGEIIDDLKARGFTVHVLTSDGVGISRLRERADDVHVVNMAREISPLGDLRSLLAWVRTLREIRPEVVLAGTPKAGLLGMVAARLVGVPARAYFLQGLRLEGSHGFKRRLLAWTERLASRCSQRVIAVSASLAEVYTKAGLHSGRPVSVAHHGSSHGVDSTFFEPRDRAIDHLSELGLEPALPVMLFVGRLTNDKGPHTLVEAMRLLGPHEQPQLLVVGAQDELDSARHLAQLEAVSSAVRVVDHIDDVRPWYAASDLLVLPTLREGMPNVVLEAAAMGVPSVTTFATGAVDSVVDGETGLLVPVEDPPALAAAIRHLLEDGDLRAQLGRAARARVVRDFQPREVAAAIVDLALH